MENNLKLKATEDTPEVLFDKEKSVFSLKGRAMPENAFEFFKPIIDWMKEYAQSPNDNTELEVYLEYFNSSSVKQIFNLLSKIDDLSDQGHQAKIIWCYKANDQLMKEKGAEFESFLDVPFEMKEI